MDKFRSLRADEVECRVGQVKQGKGLSLLLYKDARCDMAVLDEAVGPLNWKREHTRDNANCIVSIWDESKGQWVSKEDTGTESNTEAEKGKASDSFKRACVNWGIGRELYTAPFIWIAESKGGKFDRFTVQEMDVEDGRITRLAIANEKTGATVFRWAAGGRQSPAKAAPAPKPNNEPDFALTAARSRLNVAVAKYAKASSQDAQELMAKLKASPSYSDEAAWLNATAAKYESRC